jgi:hypothetical protein
MGLQIVDTLLGELVNGITQKPKRKRREEGGYGLTYSSLDNPDIFTPGFS